MISATTMAMPQRLGQEGSSFWAFCLMCLCLSPSPLCSAHPTLQIPSGKITTTLPLPCPTHSLLAPYFCPSESLLKAVIALLFVSLFA